jgi:hypothetical protein
MGNGAKAAMKRERNAKDQKGQASSQLKVNQKAMNVQCSICRQQYMQTINRKTLEDHISSKEIDIDIACRQNF